MDADKKMDADKTMCPTPDDKMLKILHDKWGYDSFRGIQQQIIESISSGKDTLGLMPTGGGKSITFQVPALAQSGVCIVITPLIALMKDQVSNLRKRGIKAAAVYSGMTHTEVISTLENAIFGGIKLLYISPERLSSELFQKKLSHMKVSFITVDEAHCICQWGYDFRPSYLHISDIRKIKPDAPILALTATATPKVVSDIQKQLGFKQENVFRMSFERKNLAYIARNTTDKESELVHILKSVNGSAIVYVRNRKGTKDISKLLNGNGISSTFYNAGLEDSVRDMRQEEWTEGKVRVMVATNAFGMGIDKPDVRLVIHIDCPDSLEAYFQEAGRAGRDGLKSYAVMLYNNKDKAKLERRINETFPDKDYIRKVYEHIAYFYQIGIGSGAGCRYEFNIDKFCQYFKHFPVQVDSALKILTRAGYIDYDCDDDGKAQIKMLLERNELNRLDSLTENENAVITSLLRNYGAVFIDYCYIDESLIAHQSGITVQETYMILKSLSERRILHFIPRKKIPHITYTQRREDMERLVFSREIYDIRKEEYKERIKAIIKYVTNPDSCRSRQLLAYFGEDKSVDCNQCDVCIEHRNNHIDENNLDEVCKRIIDILSDKNPHVVTDIYNAGIERNVVDAALKLMMEKEMIIVKDGMIYNK